MLKLILALFFLITPKTVFAHSGHEHVGSEWFHHLFEYAVVAIATLMVLRFVQRIQTMRTSRDDS